MDSKENQTQVSLAAHILWKSLARFPHSHSRDEGVCVQNTPDCLRREPITVPAASFDHTQADEQVLAAEFGVTHAHGISVKVIGPGANLLS